MRQKNDQIYRLTSLATLQTYRFVPLLNTTFFNRTRAFAATVRPVWQIRLRKHATFKMVMTTGFQKAAIRSSAMFGLGMVFTSPHDTSGVGALQLKFETRRAAAQEPLEPVVEDGMMIGQADSETLKWFVGGFANADSHLHPYGVFADILSNGKTWKPKESTDRLTLTWFKEFAAGDGDSVRAFIMQSGLFEGVDANGSYDNAPHAAEYEVMYSQDLVSIVEQFIAHKRTCGGYLSLNSKSATVFMQLIALMLAKTKPTDARYNSYNLPSLPGAKMAFIKGLVDDNSPLIDEVDKLLLRVQNVVDNLKLSQKHIILTAPVYKKVDKKLDNRAAFEEVAHLLQNTPEILGKKVSMVLGTLDVRSIGEGFDGKTRQPVLPKVHNTISNNESGKLATSIALHKHQEPNIAFVEANIIGEFSEEELTRREKNAASNVFIVGNKDGQLNERGHLGFYEGGMTHLNIQKHVSKALLGLK